MKKVNQGMVNSELSKMVIWPVSNKAQKELIKVLTWVPKEHIIN